MLSLHPKYKQQISLHLRARNSKTLSVQKKIITINLYWHRKSVWSLNSLKYKIQPYFCERLVGMLSSSPSLTMSFRYKMSTWSSTIDSNGLIGFAANTVLVFFCILALLLIGSQTDLYASGCVSWGSPGVRSSCCRWDNGVVSHWCECVCEWAFCTCKQKTNVKCWF